MGKRKKKKTLQCTQTRIDLDTQLLFSKVLGKHSFLLRPEADLLQKLKLLAQEIKDKLNNMQTVSSLSISDKTKTHKLTTAFK